MRPRPLVPLTLALALAFALTAPACGDDDGEPGGGTATGGHDTTTSQPEADEAMGGLCDLASGDLTEMADVHEAFHVRAHETLHAVATRVQELEPVVAGALLEAKSLVERDLEEATPVPELPGHAQDLVEAFATALEAIGLEAASCGAA